MEKYKTIVRTLPLAELRKVLHYLDKPNGGRAAALRSRVLQLLGSAARDDVVVALRRVTSSNDELSRASTSAAPPTTSDHLNYTSTRAVTPDIIKPFSTPSPESPEEVYTSPKYPTHPDVKFKSLPFFDEEAELIKPTTLNTGMFGQMRPSMKNLQFHLTPKQADLIRKGRKPGPEYEVQVLMRIGLLETTSAQNDCHPPGGLMIHVNNNLFPMPPTPANSQTTETQRLQQPLNITPYLKVDPTFANKIVVSDRVTMPQFQRYVAGVYLVKKRTTQDLLTRLKAKGVRVACFTKAMIIQKLKDDSNEIAPTFLRTKLVCPLGKMRLQTPCRATTCDHVQCFDCTTYLSMNEKKPTWNCPVCNKPALYENLAIDEYFQLVISSEKLPSDCTEVQLNSDGGWCAVNAPSKYHASNTTVRKHENVESDVELVSDSEPDCSFLDGPKVIATVGALASAPLDLQVVDLVSSGEENTVPQPQKRLPARVAVKSTDPSVILINSDSTSSCGSSDEDARVASRRRRPNPAARPATRARVYSSDSSDCSPAPAIVHQPTASTHNDLLPTQLARWNLASFKNPNPVNYTINRAKSSNTTIFLNKASLKRLSQTESEESLFDRRDSGQPDFDIRKYFASQNAELESNYIIGSILDEIIDNVVNVCRKKELESCSVPVVELMDSSPEPVVKDDDSASSEAFACRRSPRKRKRVIDSSDDDKETGILKSTESQACLALLGLSSSGKSVLPSGQVSQVQQQVFSSSEASTSSRNMEKAKHEIYFGQYSQENAEMEEKETSSERRRDSSFRPSILKRASGRGLQGDSAASGNTSASDGKENSDIQEGLNRAKNDSIHGDAEKDSRKAEEETIRKIPNENAPNEFMTLKRKLLGNSHLPGRVKKGRKTKHAYLSESEESTPEETTSEESEDEKGSETHDDDTDTSESGESSGSSSSSSSSPQSPRSSNSHDGSPPSEDKSPPHGKKGEPKNDEGVDCLQDEQQRTQSPAACSLDGQRGADCVLDEQQKTQPPAACSLYGPRVVDTQPLLQDKISNVDIDARAKRKRKQTFDCDILCALQTKGTSNQAISANAGSKSSTPTTHRLNLLKNVVVAPRKLLPEETISNGNKSNVDDGCVLESFSTENCSSVTVETLKIGSQPPLGQKAVLSKMGPVQSPARTSIPASSRQQNAGVGLRAQSGRQLHNSQKSVIIAKGNTRQKVALGKNGQKDSWVSDFQLNSKSQNGDGMSAGLALLKKCGKVNPPAKNCRTIVRIVAKAKSVSVVLKEDALDKKPLVLRADEINERASKSTVTRSFSGSNLTAPSAGMNTSTNSSALMKSFTISRAHVSNPNERNRLILSLGKKSDTSPASNLNRSNASTKVTQSLNGSMIPSAKSGDSNASTKNLYLPILYTNTKKCAPIPSVASRKSPIVLRRRSLKSFVIQSGPLKNPTMPRPNFETDIPSSCLNRSSAPSVGMKSATILGGNLNSSTSANLNKPAISSANLSSSSISSANVKDSSTVEKSSTIPSANNLTFPSMMKKRAPRKQILPSPRSQVVNEETRQKGNLPFFIKSLVVSKPASPNEKKQLKKTTPAPIRRLDDLLKSVTEEVSIEDRKLPTSKPDLKTSVSLCESDGDPDTIKHIKNSNQLSSEEALHSSEVEMAFSPEYPSSALDPGSDIVASEILYWSGDDDYYDDGSEEVPVSKWNLTDEYVVTDEVEGMTIVSENRKQWVDEVDSEDVPRSKVYRRSASENRQIIKKFRLLARHGPEKVATTAEPPIFRPAILNHRKFSQMQLVRDLEKDPLALKQPRKETLRPVDELPQEPPAPAPLRLSINDFYQKVKSKMMNTASGETYRNPCNVTEPAELDRKLRPRVPRSYYERSPSPLAQQLEEVDTESNQLLCSETMTENDSNLFRLTDLDKTERCVTV